MKTSKITDHPDRYKLYFENAQEAVFILETSGNVVEVNPAGVQLLNRPLRQIVGHHISEFIIPEDVERARTEFEQRLATGMGYGIGFSISRPDHKEVVADVASRVVEVDGKQYVLSIAHDVTERVHLQKSLVDANKKLNQAQRMEAIARLAGGITHDFNNVLAIISLQCELLLNKISTDDPVRKGIEEIAQAKDRAAALTRQLMVFSRGRPAVTEVTDLCKLIRDLEPMLKRILRENIALTFEIASGPLEVLCDPSQLEQVILNLVINSRDAVDANGHIVVRTRHINKMKTNARLRSDLPQLEDEPLQVLEVEDNGRGMTEDVQEQLFEPFFTTKEVGKGTGIGLSTTYGIIKQSGGNVQVESTPNKGTKFTIYFPVAKSIEFTKTLLDKIPKRTKRPDISPQTILLVEDNSDFRNVLSRLLTENGYHVLTAEDGKDGLNVYASHMATIDLVISDIVMPKMDGREMIENIQKNNPEIKVIYISGYTHDILKDYGTLDQRTYFLEKPFSSTALLDKASELLEN